MDIIQEEDGQDFFPLDLHRQPFEKQAEEHCSSNNSLSSRISSDSQPKPDELPKVLWLRGDEQLCEQFIIDADEAMEILGIKRSRLTQISGKELRVARRRIGRYVRPVYREIDLHEYLAQTKIATSHAKSKTAIDQAASELKWQSKVLGDQLKAFEANITKKLQQQLARETEQLTCKFEQMIELNTGVFKEAVEAIINQNNRLEGKLASNGLKQDQQQKLLSEVEFHVQEVQEALQQKSKILTQIVSENTQKRRVRYGLARRKSLCPKVKHTPVTSPKKAVRKCKRLDRVSRSVTKLS